MNEKIDRSISSLPRDLERPKVIKASATDIPAFYINLTVRDERPAPAQDELHPVSERFAALSRFASQVITKRIEQLPEVAMVDMSGSVASEILIIPDETKLRQACSPSPPPCPCTARAPGRLRTSATSCRRCATP